MLPCHNNNNNEAEASQTESSKQAEKIYRFEALCSQVLHVLNIEFACYIRPPKKTTVGG